MKDGDIAVRPTIEGIELPFFLYELILTDAAWNTTGVTLRPAVRTYRPTSSHTTGTVRGLESLTVVRNLRSISWCYLSRHNAIETVPRTRVVRMALVIIFFPPKLSRIR